MPKVSSTAIAEIRYRPERKTLYVVMTDGSRLAYDNVPEDVYESFLGAGSKGQFFNANIRNSYSFRYTS